MKKPVKIAIIGGAGKMGAWFAGFLAKDGKEVVIFDTDTARLRKTGKRLQVKTSTVRSSAVKNADVILVSVPINTFENVIKELAPNINSKQIVIDMTSVKTEPVKIMHKYIKTGLVLGTHPVFGPGAQDLQNQNFVLTPTSEKETKLAKKAAGYLTERGARVTLMSPEEHDEIMTVILGLSHFISIVSADTIFSLDKFKKMESIGGTTYKVLVMLIESVISEDPELYASLQMNLPGITKVEARFLKNAQRWSDIVAGKNKQEFVAKMTALKEKLQKSDPAYKKAYENMYKLLKVSL